MKASIKLAGVLLLCILLGMSFLTCSKVVDDEEEQSIFGETFGLYRITSSGSSTEMGMVAVPFLEHAPALQLLNVRCDFNGDGVIATYKADADSQEEWIVQNVPVCLTGTDYSFYFSLVDTGVKSGSSVKVEAYTSDDAVFLGPGSGGTPPAPWVRVEHTVTMQVMDVENNGTPEDGYIGAGSAYGQLSPLRLGSGAIQNPPRDDIDGGSYFYRPDVSDAPQGPNTCVPHSIANSLAWLARKHAFTDSFHTPANDDLDPYNVNTEQGVYELGWDLAGTYEKRGSYTPAKGVKKEDTVGGKEAFVQKKKLPVETTRIPQSSSDFSGKGVFEEIKKAMQDGCDVEVTYYLPDKKMLHQMTVVGFADIKFGNEPYRTLLVHDPNTNSYNDLHEVQADSITVPKFPIDGKLHTARIAFAIKECYKEPQTACTGLSGTYYCAVSDMHDPGDHYEFVGDPFQQPVVFTITDASITATGQSPFVDVSGTIDEGCNFTADGSGTVAGYPNVTVQTQGIFSNGTVDGSYIMGAGGELPGDSLITFYFTGSKQ